MAKIPLRTYVKDIEHLIERGEIEQAVSHAKNILKSYPKHIDTYRLLGKAFLESQRYSEAADILQRVLSVIPDDFVSQIGMSIIREDEGNLDAAIWHMERAYEIQPFNPAVQDELRRLYGRRDGIEPPKIRLTRGALVRMYARGELYPQAIAETRAALAEDSQRLDLQVLLARLYFLSGQKIEATEICSTLLSKLPYCLEANRILTEVLPGTNRAEDAPKFQARINALDPYAAFVSPSAPTVDQVPDQAVVVEQYIWDAAMEGAETQSPDWARNIGVQWEESKEEQLPDWLNGLKPEASAPTPPPTARPPVEPPQAEAPGAAGHAEESGASEELIPDWMKSAGWAASDRSADEIMKEAYAQEEEKAPAEIAPAEIPDWLKSAAPEGTGEAPAEGERDTWLESLFEQPGGANGKNASTTPPLTVESSGQEETSALPDWLSGLGQEPGESQGLPDWSALETPGAAAEPPSGMEETPSAEAPQEPAGFEASAAGLPDWGQIAGPENETEPAAGFDNAPDWLKSFEPEAEQPTEPAAASNIDWMQSFAAPSPEAAQPASDVPDWLKAMETEEEPPAEELPAAPEGLPAFDQAAQPEEAAPAGELPDWLKAMEPSEETSFDRTSGPVNLEPGSEAISAPAEAGVAPDTFAFDQTSEEALSANQLRPVDEPPVSANEEPAAAPESLLSQPAEAPEEQAAPESLRPQPAEAAEELPAAEAAAPDFSDMDAAMAWLEALAAKQGADAETLKISRPEDRSEVPPEWIRKQTGELKLPEEGIGEPSQVEAVSMAETEPMPAAEAELPDWLKGLEPEQPEELPAPVEAASEEALPTAETTDESWLSALSVPEETAVPEPPAEVEQPAAPESLLSQPAAPEELAEEAAMPDLSDMDAAMAWLEALAAKQGADEETLKISRPEDRSEIPPEWVRKQTGELKQPDETGAPDEFTAEAAAPLEEQPAVEAELPDWLRSLETEEITPGSEEQVAPEEPIAAQGLPATDKLHPVEEQAAAPEEQAAPESLRPQPAEAPEELAAPESLLSQPAEEQPAAEAAAPDFSDMDAAMAWLEALAAKQGADEETLKISRPEDRSEIPPEWIRKQTGELTMPGKEQAAAPDDMAAPESLLSQPAAPEEQAAPEELPAAEEQPAVAEPPLPDWMLSAMSAEEGVELAKPETSEATEPIQQTWEGEPISTDAEQPAAPESLRPQPAAAPEELAAPESLHPQPAEEQPAAEAAAPDFSDMDAAMAWLEALAAKQGADEETLKISRPEDRSEVTPEWIKKEAAEEQAAAPEELAAPESLLSQPAGPDELAAEPESLRPQPASEEQPAAEELPEAMELPEAEETPVAEQPAVEPAPPEATLPADLPDWLKDVGNEPAEETSAWIEEEPAAQQPVETGADQWRPEFEETAQPAEAEPLPDWLQQPVQEAAPQAEASVPDWLASLEEEESKPRAMSTGELRSAWETESQGKPAVPEPSRQPAPAGAATEGLNDLQSALKYGDLDRALEGYGQLIQNGEHLEETIHDLRDALYQFPVDISIWQTLGDAYARNNQLQEALDAYTKAEELLR